eukprot:1399056-Pyramimonas_sp.AAC.1
MLPEICEHPEAFQRPPQSLPGRSWRKKRIPWGRSLRNASRKLQTPEDSLSDECSGDSDIHDQASIDVPQSSRPWIPYLRASH